MLRNRMFQCFLMIAAGEGQGGGGAGGAAPPAPPAPPPEAPVTRAEFAALQTKLDALSKVEPPKVEPPKVEPPKVEPKPGDAEVPQWARDLQQVVGGFVATQASSQIAARKAQVIQAITSGMPEANRNLAALAVEGLLASSGIQIDVSTDVAKVAEQLGATLRTQHESLFKSAGSSFSALPVGPDGKIDYSGVRDLSELSPEMLRALPVSEYARLRVGAPSAGASGGFRPRSKVH